MLQVNHKITIGSAVFKSGARTRLIDLRSSAALDIPVNTCRLVFSPPDHLSLSPEDPVTVELGYEDNLSLVFSGIVGAVDWGIDRVTIHAISSFQKLLVASFNLFYEKAKAGDIVSDVIDRLKLSSGKVDSGLEFPAYALGDNRQTSDYLRFLAGQCGFDFYADTSDQAVFAAYQPSETHECQYGRNILTFTAEDPAPSVTGVEIYGESPSSFGQGAESYSWLTKQEVQGKAGETSGIVKRVADPTVRTQETASKIATALLEKKTQKRRGSLRVLGMAAIKLGDAVKVSGLPVASQNGTFKVTRVQQILNSRQGFYTVIDWEEK